MRVHNNNLLESLGAAPAMPTAASADSAAKLPYHSYSQKGGVTSSVEERALRLLGSGIKQEQVASALGVTAARITQLLSEPAFSAEVTRLRCESLHSHTMRDSEYDSLEDKLLVKLEKALPMILRPADILKALSVVNAAKRRGVDAPDVTAANVNVVSLMLPNSVVQKFAVNIDNQVIQAGEQNLLTMTSSALLKMAAATPAPTAAAHLPPIPTAKLTLDDL